MESYEMREKKDTLSLVPVICFVAGLHMRIMRLIAYVHNTEEVGERQEVDRN